MDFNGVVPTLNLMKISWSVQKLEKGKHTATACWSVILFSLWKKGRLKKGICERQNSDLEADSETANILYFCGGVIKYLGRVTF
jgi:hypothetical protein